MEPLTTIFRVEEREYAMEVGGAIYFAIFITLGAFIGLNLFVVVVTTNLEQMMKTGEEEGHLQHITFNEVSWVCLRTALVPALGSSRHLGCCEFEASLVSKGNSRTAMTVGWGERSRTCAWMT